jgi:hypothetical protein
MREKKAKKDKKNDKEKEKYASDWDKSVKNSKHETVQVVTLIYFILPYRDGCSKAQGSQLTPWILKNSAFS